MTRPRSRSSFRSGATSTAALAVVGAAAVLIADVRSAAAQACCAGGAVVTPTRLAIYEDAAVGLESRAQGAMGVFGADGRYVGSSSSEQVFEQALAASVRVSRAAQVALVMRTVQTHRQAGALDEWGGGFGDVSASARYELVQAAEHRRFPGIALLAGATAPTGTAPEAATNPLATDATGSGSYDASLGVGFEKAVGPVLAGVSLWATHRFSRTIAVAGGSPLTASFGLRGSWLAYAGYVLPSETTLAVYASGFEEGDSTIAGVTDPATGRRQTTVGVAAVLPFANAWRVRGAAFVDPPVSSLGRNQRAGAGGTIALVRAWF
jgi:hypothetical protein